MRQLERFLKGIYVFDSIEPGYLREEEEQIGHLKDLTYANFNRVTSFGDKLIYDFCTYAPNLEMIELNGLERFSDNTIGKILKVLPNLKVLQVNETPNITDEKLEELRESYPHVKIIRNI
jgi:hypothetical protein